MITDTIKEALAGNQDAYTEIYNKVKPRVEHISYRFFSNKDDDFIQKVMISVLLKLNSFKGNSNITTWATRIAINEAKMKIRTLNRWKYVDIEEYSNNFIKTSEPLIFSEEVSQLVQSPIYKDVILGFTHEEIAQRYGWTVPKSKAYLRRLRQAARSFDQPFTLDK